MENLNTLSTQFLTVDENNCAASFKKIANDLMSNYSIFKGEGSNAVRYELIEIEFYYCSEKHPDIITYPRKAAVGDWFFHNSGVDICLESNIEKTEKNKVISLSNGEHYGGILIRSLKKFEQGKDAEYITGPLNCLDELFYKFSAFVEPTDFPVLKKDNHSDKLNISSCGRYFNFYTTIESKLRSKLKEYFDKYNNKPQKDIILSTDDVNNFEQKLLSPYRFYIEDEIININKYKAKPGQGKSLFYKE